MPPDLPPALPHRVPAAAPPTWVPKQIAITDRALRGNAGVIEPLRLLGEARLRVGGADALVTLQGALHARTAGARSQRSRQDSRSDAIRTRWEPLPERAAR